MRQVTGFKVQRLAMLVKLHIVGHMVIWLI